MTKHLHKYRRVDIGQPQVTVENGQKRIGPKKEVWVMKCGEINCTHYTRMRSKVSCPLLLGQLGKCNKCNEPFVLDRRALRMAKPTCKDCVKTKREVEINDANKFFDDLLGKVGINDIK
jgi:hypothetical protein